MTSYTLAEWFSAREFVRNLDHAHRKVLFQIFDSPAECSTKKIAKRTFATVDSVTESLIFLQSQGAISFACNRWIIVNAALEQFLNNNNRVEGAIKFDPEIETPRLGS